MVFCSQWTPIWRFLLGPGRELRLRWPQPALEARPPATKTVAVTSRHDAKIVLFSSASPPTFVMFWWERHKTPPQTPPRPLFCGLVTPGRNHGRPSVEAGARLERRAVGGRDGRAPAERAALYYDKVAECLINNKAAIWVDKDGAEVLDPDNTLPIAPPGAGPDVEGSPGSGGRGRGAVARHATRGNGGAPSCAVL